MTEKGPVSVEISQGFSIFGQKGGFPDSDLIECRFDPGKVNVEVSSQSGCVILSTKEETVYLPINELVHPAFRLVLPTDRLILEAQVGIPIIQQLPDSLKEKLKEMLGDFY